MYQPILRSSDLFHSIAHDSPVVLLLSDLLLSSLLPVVVVIVWWDLLLETAILPFDSVIGVVSRAPHAKTMMTAFTWPANGTAA